MTNKKEKPEKSVYTIDDVKEDMGKVAKLLNDIVDRLVKTEVEVALLQAESGGDKGNEGDTTADIKPKEGRLTEAQKRELILKAFGYKRIDKLGGSYHVILPIMWVRVNTLKVDGEAWAKIVFDGENIVITPIDEAQLNKIMEGTNVKSSAKTS